MSDMLVRCDGSCVVSVSGSGIVVVGGATPMTGSAAEVVDLLNLLIPKSELPGGLPLKRSDFFTHCW